MFIFLSSCVTSPAPPPRRPRRRAASFVAFANLRSAIRKHSPVPVSDDLIAELSSKSNLPLKQIVQFLAGLAVFVLTAMCYLCVCVSFVSSLRAPLCIFPGAPRAPSGVWGDSSRPRCAFHNAINSTSVLGQFFPWNPWAKKPPLRDPSPRALSVGWSCKGAGAAFSFCHVLESGPPWLRTLALLRPPFSRGRSSWHHVEEYVPGLVAKWLRVHALTACLLLALSCCQICGPTWCSPRG